ncbi:hypothetical protein D0463_13550 [Bacillus sp. V59.32b]|nr:hypothetical protein D0463_13550 [Bacillus sp. V59.32b]
MVTVTKEGEDFHVELEVEIDPNLTIAEADDIKDRLEERIMAEKGVTEVTIEFDEDDGVTQWRPVKDQQFAEEKKARE